MGFLGRSTAANWIVGRVLNRRTSDLSDHLGTAADVRVDVSAVLDVSRTLAVSCALDVPSAGTSAAGGYGGTRFRNGYPCAGMTSENGLVAYSLLPPCPRRSLTLGNPAVLVHPPVGESLRRKMCRPRYWRAVRHLDVSRRFALDHVVMCPRCARPHRLRNGPLRGRSLSMAFAGSATALLQRWR